jgi:hypothetical protein
MSSSNCWELKTSSFIKYQICYLNYPREETTAPQTGSLFLPRTSRKLIEGVVSDRTVVLRKQPCRDLLASRFSPANDRLAVLAVRPLLRVLYQWYWSNTIEWPSRLGFYSAVTIVIVLHPLYQSIIPYYVDDSEPLQRSKYPSATAGSILKL